MSSLNFIHFSRRICKLKTRGRILALPLSRFSYGLQGFPPGLLELRIDAAAQGWLDGGCSLLKRAGGENSCRSRVLLSLRLWRGLAARLKSTCFDPAAQPLALGERVA